MKKILTIILLISIPLSCGAKSIFKAGSDFYDENHNVINAHGAGFLKIKDTYYWYGELRTTHQDNTGKINVYSSNDLYKWKYRGIALDLSGKKDKYSIERPKVIYNDNTKKYVMWFHVELHGHYQTAIAGVAQSDSPAGPFEFINITWPNKKTLPVFSDIHNIKESWYIKNIERGEQAFKRDFNRGQAFRDMTLFKDDNGKAYLIYASEDNLSLHISELDKTYTQLDGNFSRVLVGLKNEAPTIFKHNGLYYLITSGLKGFSPTDARSAVSKNIFGPWTLLGNPVVSNNAEDKRNTFSSQGTYVLKDPTGKGFIFIADQWNPGNLINSKYIWLPIEWQGNRPVIKWKSEWSY